MSVPPPTKLIRNGVFEIIFSTVFLRLCGDGRGDLALTKIKAENKKPRPEQCQFRSIGMDTAPAGVDPLLIFYLASFGSL